MSQLERKLYELEGMSAVHYNSRHCHAHDTVLFRFRVGVKCVTSLPIVNRMAVLIFLLSVVSGCAQHTWAPGPGMSANNFEPTKAECSLVARHGGSELVAYGRPSFVAGATLGHAIGESIRAQADFNDCMSARGWRIVTPETIAASKGKGEVIKAANAAATKCLADVRTRETYAAIEPYLGDPKTGKHSMTQLAISRYATPSEARLLTSYYDDTSICFDVRTSEFEKVSPEAALIMREARAFSKAEALHVIKHDQTWSAFFEHIDQAVDTVSARLKTVRI